MYDGEEERLTYDIAKHAAVRSAPSSAGSAGAVRSTSSAEILPKIMLKSFAGPPWPRRERHCLPEALLTILWRIPPPISNPNKRARPVQWLRLLRRIGSRASRMQEFRLGALVREGVALRRGILT
eukprot:2363326-Pyramimonas_sp.AAC.1